MMSNMDTEKATWRLRAINWGSYLVLVAFVFSLYLPGVARDVLFLAALAVTYRERDLLKVDAGLKRIGYAMLIYILLFTVLSTDHGRSAKGAYDMLRGMLVFYVGYLLAIKLEAPQRFALLTVGAFVFLVGNFAFSHDEFVFPFYGYFENPNNSAVVIIIFTVLSVPMLSRYPGCRMYWLIGGVGFLMGIYLLIMTNSRGAWLGLLGGLVMSIYLMPYIKRHHRIGVSGLLICALAGVVLFANTKGLSLSLRDKIWFGLLTDTWESHPWFGYGLNRIKDVLAALELPTQTAHNLFLEMFVASGVVGLLYMVVLMAALFRYLISFRYPNSATLYIGVMGLTAYLLMAQFDLKMSSFTFMASISLFVAFIYSQRLPRDQV